MNGGHAGANRAFADFEFAASGNQGSVADLDAFDISDGIVGAGRAVKRNSEIASAGFGLSGKTGCGKTDGENSKSENDSGMADWRVHGPPWGPEQASIADEARSGLSPGFRRGMLSDGAYIPIRFCGSRMSS